MKRARAEPDSRRAVVTIIYRSVPLYRVPFYEALRADLERRGVTLRLVYGQPDSEETSKQDTGSISWGHQIGNVRIPIGSRSVLWQPCSRLIGDSDLVIVEQASKLLLNYILLARQRLGGSKVAFWGHGQNFQQLTASRLGEALKRWISRWPHWWFAYTDTSAGVIRRLAYPAERITVVQNAMDTDILSERRRSIDEETLAALRLRHRIHGTNVGIYAGGLYAAKRLQFLLDAAQALRRRVVDFELVVIGAGPDQYLVEQAAREHEWIHYLGPQFGPEKVPYFAMSEVMLMPGAVGLAVLDAFALTVPLVTIDSAGHGPEIDYLRHGENGLKLGADTDPERYATAVAELLSDAERLDHLKRGCEASAKVYTLEEMVRRFAGGVLEALEWSSGASRCAGESRGSQRGGQRNGGTLRAR